MRGRACPIVVFAIGMTIFAWTRGWRWWALIPGVPSILMRAAFLYMTLVNEFLFSDTAFVLLMGSGLCVCILGLMAFIGRDYVDDD